MQTTELDCPLCMEPLEIDDVNFYPCTCGYQVCRFCWHRIRTDENGLCPACRKAYSEDPAVYTPLSQDEIQRIIKERKQKDTQRKQKLTENRKHLANVRVVQKNLVFVVGLTQRLADSELLKRTEYFGKFGKIHKIVINNSTNYAGPQGPSASAYITFNKEEDAHKAILAVSNAYLDGRTLKASLGTTKYCSYFLRNISCPKPDCMYLHDLGDEAASFTKEEMQEGKHQEYEQQLLSNYAQKMGVSTEKDSNDLWSGSTDPSIPSESDWDTKESESETSYSPHLRDITPGSQLYNQNDDENYWEEEDWEQNESSATQINKTEQQIIENKQTTQTNSNTSQTQNKPPSVGQTHSKPPSVGQTDRYENTTQQGWLGNVPPPGPPAPGPPSNPILDYQPAPGLFEPGQADSFCSLGLSNLHLKVSSDDDLGFDPWNESSKGLADLLREEVTQTNIAQPSLYSAIPTRPTFIPHIPQQYPSNPKDDFKSWQEGFRALLPNININFAGWSSTTEGQHQTANEWSPATQTDVPASTQNQAVRPPPGFEARKPEPQLPNIDDPSIVWSKTIGSKDAVPIVPGIIPNGFSSLSSNTTDLPGAVAVQSSGMLNDSMDPTVKQFLALFDASSDNKDLIDNNNPNETQRKPQSIQSQWNPQALNKKQTQSDRRGASSLQAKENGKIVPNDKHVLKARENLKQPESSKRKVTGRLA